MKNSGDLVGYFHAESRCLSTNLITYLYFRDGYLVPDKTCPYQIQVRRLRERDSRGRTLWKTTSPRVQVQCPRASSHHCVQLTALLEVETVTGHQRRTKELATRKIRVGIGCVKRTNIDSTSITRVTTPRP